MKRYANLSARSGVQSYDYDSVNYEYITVKFKDGSIYTYTTASNSLSTIMDMIGRGNIGVGLNRYINKYKPSYIKGSYSPTIVPKKADSTTTKVSYPKGNVSTVVWDRNHSWVKVTFNDGSVKTYTEESCGVRDVTNIIKAAIKGYGLIQYIKDNKPLSVEEGAGR